MPTNYTGETLDRRYSIGELLGKGGMGSVYLGHHLKIGRKVAVKFLHAEFAASPELIKRFYREAQAASAVEHSNIINVLDVGVSEGGDPYLVMEYLEGESLSGMLKRKDHVDLSTACGVLDPTLRALAAAHEKGIIHRDLKPENIFLVHEPKQPVVVKVIDFGISKIVDTGDRSQLTQTGTLLGTPAYMAPEQVRGAKNIDHRADIYSIGVILYEMLTGKTPFTGENYNDLLVNVLTEDPIPPRKANNDFPPEAEALTIQMLDRNPDNRPQSCLDVIEQMQKLEAYAGREAQLTVASAGLTNSTFAGGDLGPQSDAPINSGEVAAELLSDMGMGDTKKEWMTPVSSEALARKRLGILLGGIGAALLILLLFSWFLQSKGKEADVSGPVQALPSISSHAPLVVEDKNATAVPSEDQVSIEIRDLPSNASIYYNNALVPSGMNPFQVTKKTVLMKLEIKAPGHKSRALNVVPATDLIIQGTLSPIEIDSRHRGSAHTPKTKPKFKTKTSKEFEDEFL